jgi:excisionase family DNA binding protein
MSRQELLTIAEVCALLKVHERTVYRWLKGGRLRAFKAGKLWRIPAGALDAFLQDAGPAPDAGPALNAGPALDAGRPEPAASAPLAPVDPASAPTAAYAHPISPDLDTKSPGDVGYQARIEPAPPARATSDRDRDCGPTRGGRAGNVGIVEERRTVRIRYETLEGVIRYDESNPADFEVLIDHPVREKIIEHFTSERDFKTPASRKDDRPIERARPVDDPSYFSLALCTLHVSTGVRVDW